MSPLWSSQYLLLRGDTFPHRAQRCSQGSKSSNNSPQSPIATTLGFTMCLMPNRAAGSCCSFASPRLTPVDNGLLSPAAQREGLSSSMSFNLTRKLPSCTLTLCLLLPIGSFPSTLADLAGLSLQSRAKEMGREHTRQPSGKAEE